MIAHTRQHSLWPMAPQWAVPNLWTCFVSEGGRVIDLYHAQLALRNVGDLDLLDGDSLAGAPVECLVDGSESSLADAIAQPLQFGPC